MPWKDESGIVSTWRGIHVEIHLFYYESDGWRLLVKGNPEMPLNTRDLNEAKRKSVKILLDNYLEIELDLLELQEETEGPSDFTTKLKKAFRKILGKDEKEN